MSIINATTYLAIRNQMQPGDVVAFGGSNWLSDSVKALTQSTVSHVGIVARAAGAGADALVAESTVQVTPPMGKDDDGPNLDTLGVRIAPCGTVVQHYQGDAWWLPLSPSARTAFTSAAFDTYLQQVAGRPFDPLGGGGVLLRRPLRRMIALGLIDPTADDLTMLFCSELVAGALRAGGIVPPAIEPSDVTPADICSWAIFGTDGWHLQGSNSAISPFNALAPATGSGRALRRRVLRRRIRDTLLQKPAVLAELTALLGGGGLAGD